MMTLGNMRENGVRLLWCHHEAILDVSAFSDDVAVPSLGPRMGRRSFTCNTQLSSLTAPWA